MSIATYSELQTAVGNYLDDTSLSSFIPDWITMAESRINRDIGNIRTSWVDGVLTATPSSRSVALPSTFVEASALFLTTDDQYKRLIPFFPGTIELKTADGTPEMWCVNGANIDLDCPCAAADTFILRYRAKWTLSDSAPTSWLLTNHPDLYLSSTLVEAYAFRGNEASALRWEQRYRMAAEEIDRNEARNVSIVPLSVDAALMPLRGFDFTTGQ